MRTRIVLSFLFISLFLVGGCKKDYNEKKDHTSSRLMLENKLFDKSTATRIEALGYEANATHKLAEEDIDWLLSVLDKSPTDENYTLRTYFIISRMDPIVVNSYTAKQKQQMFELGSRILASSPTKDFMRLTGGLTLLEKSGDKRGVAIAQKFENNPHWSIRKVSKKTVLALNGKG